MVVVVTCDMAEDRLLGLLLPIVRRLLLPLMLVAMVAIWLLFRRTLLPADAWDGIRLLMLP